MNEKLNYSDFFKEQGEIWELIACSSDFIIEMPYIR